MDNLPPPPPYTPHDPNPRTPSLTTATSSPRVTFHYNNGPSRDQDISFISGVAYFEMHPPKPSRVTHMLSYRLNLPPDATPRSIPFPQPEHNMLDRDVDHQDWATFLHHLLFSPTGEETLDTNESERPSVLRDMKGPQRGFHYSSASGHDIQQIKLARFRRCRDVIEEWNRGFFLPRGLKIILNVQSAPNSSAIGNSSARRERAENQWESSRVLFDVKKDKQPKNKSDAAARTERGMALYEAVSNQDRTLVQLLLDAGADVNARPNCAVPALTLALKNGDGHIFKMLLKKKPNLEATPPAGATALYTAVSKEYTALARLLLVQGANPNAKPPGGEPALYRAASKGRIDLVEALLE